MKKAVVFIFNKTEEIEAIAPIDILRRANVDVTVVSLEESLTVQGRSGIKFEADKVFEEVINNNFDVAILAGGAGIYDIINDTTSKKFTTLLDFFKRHLDDEKIIASICAAPFAFEKMGLIGSRKCTAHYSVADNILTYIDDETTVLDRNVITSQGAGTAIEFSLKIVSTLLGKNTADEIAKSICLK